MVNQNGRGDDGKVPPRPSIVKKYASPKYLKGYSFLRNCGNDMRAPVRPKYPSPKGVRKTRGGTKIPVRLFLPSKITTKISIPNKGSPSMRNTDSEPILKTCPDLPALGGNKDRFKVSKDNGKSDSSLLEPMGAAFGEYHVKPVDHVNRDCVEEFTESKEVSADRERVKKVLESFQKLHTKFKKENKAKSKMHRHKADMKAAKTLKRERKWLNTSKRLGPIPGVETGDEFKFRAEVKVIGLHQQFWNGIDYMKKDGILLATSIVATNRYENDLGSVDSLTYIGQGSNSLFKAKQPSRDQTLTRGNLALMNSMEERTPVRVIRKRSWSSMLVYDGLYLVVDCSQERSSSGKLVFKFVLKRISTRKRDVHGKLQSPQWNSVSRCLGRTRANHCDSELPKRKLEDIDADEPVSRANYRGSELPKCKLEDKAINEPALGFLGRSKAANCRDFVPSRCKSKDEDANESERIADETIILGRSSANYRDDGLSKRKLEGTDAKESGSSCLRRSSANYGDNALSKSKLEDRVAKEPISRCPRRSSDNYREEALAKLRLEDRVAKEPMPRCAGRSSANYLGDGLFKRKLEGTDAKELGPSCLRRSSANYGDNALSKSKLEDRVAKEPISRCPRRSSDNYREDARAKLKLEDRVAKEPMPGCAGRSSANYQDDGLSKRKLEGTDAKESGPSCLRRSSANYVDNALSKSKLEDRVAKEPISRCPRRSSDNYREDALAKLKLKDKVTQEPISRRLGRTIANYRDDGLSNCNLKDKVEKEPVLRFFGRSSTNYRDHVLSKYKLENRFAKRQSSQHRFGRSRANDRITKKS
ncbi:hypothetical protein Tsubulata_023762 [Turnera subulata]|uniref:YDG domain-containing protein n=1 Tax=Turnera subulata TaxID=218843 RepID=A0A9Q0FC32_9ROSI|nr:hypothetical protein Tsubulata_023762 [Turnera subulata]